MGKAWETFRDHPRWGYIRAGLVILFTFSMLAIALYWT